MDAYARFSPPGSKWTKHTVAEHVSIGGNGPIIVGTAEQVADGLEAWINEADVDGFNFVSDPSQISMDCTRTNAHSGICPLPGVFPGHHRSSAARVAEAWSLLGRLCCPRRNIP